MAMRPTAHRYRFHPPGLCATACIESLPRLHCRDMWVIYLEAFAAVAIMGFFVWWTMRGKK
jgi:hypothetical protein